MREGSAVNKKFNLRKFSAYFVELRHILCGANLYFPPQYLFTSVIARLLRDNCKFHLRRSTVPSPFQRRWLLSWKGQLFFLRFLDCLNARRSHDVAASHEAERHEQRTPDILS